MLEEGTVIVEKGESQPVVCMSPVYSPANFKVHA